MPMENKISTDIFTTINHREIDFYADKLQDGAIPAVFSCTELLEWLDKTGSRLFDEDFIMDYGKDCLRLYLLFEKNTGYVKRIINTKIDALYLKYQRSFMGGGNSLIISDMVYYSII